METAKKHWISFTTPTTYLKWIAPLFFIGLAVLYATMNRYWETMLFTSIGLSWYAVSLYLTNHPKALHA